MTKVRLDYHKDFAILTSIIEHNAETMGTNRRDLSGVWLREDV